MNLPKRRQGRQSVFWNAMRVRATKCLQTVPNACFQALQNGHSFIRLSGDEADALSALAPVVGTSAAPLILEGRRLFLGRMWQLEYDLAAEIKRLAAAGTSAPDAAGARQNLAKWFQGAGSEGQRDAAALALLQFFMVITGGPGTGKTTTVAKLLH